MIPKSPKIVALGFGEINGVVLQLLAESSVWERFRQAGKTTTRTWRDGLFCFDDATGHISPESPHDIPRLLFRQWRFF